MIVLGIESSCDETAIAIIKSEQEKSVLKKEILSHVILSQIDEHKKFGGVFPEVASRLHLENIGLVFDEAIQKSGISLNEIDAIAATCGPGLIGSVVVGASFGKGLALSLNKPFISVNHLLGHALMSRFIYDDLEFPYLLFLASGGHSIIGILKSPTEFIKLGGTIDDSAGECFDKVARMLDLPYPGGPNIEKIAEFGDETRFNFPIPLNNKSCNLSFSGLKTAVLYQVQELKKQKSALTVQDKADIAASFQKTVAEVFRKKITNAKRVSLELLKEYEISSVVLSGGVAANKKIRSVIESFAAKNKYKCYIPPLKLCTDNGAMIAWAGTEIFRINPKINDISTDIIKEHIFNQKK